MTTVHLVVNTGEATELCTTSLTRHQVMEHLNRMAMIPAKFKDMTGLEDFEFVDDFLVTPWSIVYIFELPDDGQSGE